MNFCSLLTFVPPLQHLFRITFGFVFCYAVINNTTMAIDALNTLEIIEVMENFLSRIRPQENIRHKFDISYKIENQSITIFEIRPVWNNPEQKRENPVAKTTFVKSKNCWKVFWKRANLKWYAYQPATVNTLKEFVRLVEEDKMGCFWG